MRINISGETRKQVIASASREELQEALRDQNPALADAGQCVLDFEQYQSCGLKLYMQDDGLCLQIHDMEGKITAGNLWPKHVRAAGQALINLANKYGW